MTRTRGFLVLALTGIILVLTGCIGRWTGGGAVVGASGWGKATFGFNYTCDEGTQRGQLQYVDHAPGAGGPKQVRFHGDFGIDFDDCIGPGEPQPPIVFAVGTYEPQPTKLGPGGVLLLFLVDGGEPGTDDDVFEIILEGGIYDGYMNGGPIIGGNIQQH